MGETAIKVCTKQPSGALKCEPLHDAFSRACGELFAHLGAKQGEGLSPEAIRTAIGDPGVKGPAAAAAATLWFDKTFSELDEDGDEVITLAELTEYNRAKKKWKDDSDTVLVEACLEIKREIARMDENIKTLEKQRDAAPSGSDKHAQLEHQLDAAKLERELAQDVLDEHKKEARKKLGEYNKMRRLFLYSTSYFDDFYGKIKTKRRQTNDLGSFYPDPYRIKQDKMGTCYLASALASYCHRHSRDAEYMVSWMRGQFNVSFRGAGSVSVDEPTDAELALFDEFTSHQEWMATIYKAVGELVIKKGGKGVKDPVTGVNTLDASGVPARLMRSWNDDFFQVNLGVPIHLLTGQPVKGTPIWLITKGGVIWKNIKNDAMEIEDPRAGFSEKTTITELHEHLTGIARGKRVATAGIGQGRHLKKDADGNRIPDAWSRNHAYAVIDYAPSSRDRAAGTVTLFNPHGKKRTTTLGEFHQAFDHLAWAT